MSAAVGLLLLAALVVADQVAFRVLFDENYLRWYVDNGAAISLLLAALTFAWGDLNKQTELISVHPAAYAAGWVELFVFPLQAIEASLRPAREERRREVQFERSVAEMHRTGAELRRKIAALREDPNLSEQLKALLPDVDEPDVSATDLEPPPTLPARLPVFDPAVTVLFALALIVGALAWMLVVVPVQYFVYLVTGAPAREACTSSMRSVLRREGKLDVFAAESTSVGLSQGALESGLSARPVGLTAAITALALFVVAKLI